METFQGLLQELIDLVKTASPKLWEIAVRQVYANVASDLMWLFFLIPIMILTSIWMKKFYKKCKNLEKEKEECNSITDVWDRKDRRKEIDNRLSDTNLLFGITCAIEILLGLVMIIIFSNIIPKLINPEYYAIQILIDLVK